jgi:hypothetical protein
MNKKTKQNMIFHIEIFFYRSTDAWLPAILGNPWGGRLCKKEYSNMQQIELQIILYIYIYMLEK